MNPIKELLDFIISSVDNSNKLVVLGSIPSNLIEMLEIDSDIDLKGYKFSIDAYSIKHILKNHSDKLKENSRGQEIITAEDFLLLPEVLKNPDLVFYDGKNNIGNDTFQFQKLIGNKYIVIKEVRTGRKQLALNTMRIILKK